MERKTFLKFSALVFASPYIPWIENITHIYANIEIFRKEFETTVRPVFEKNQKELSDLREGGNLDKIEMLRMYYPIYRIAQEAFDVPWYLLWLIHDAESGLSTDPIAFGNTRENYGAMQRAKNTYGEVEVESIAFSYKYLANLPQNHPDDWREILWAAAKISRDAENAKRSYAHNNWNRALEEAQHAYCSKPEAIIRIERFRKLKEIFRVLVHSSSDIACQNQATWRVEDL